MSSYLELLDCVRRSVPACCESGAVVLPDELHLQALWIVLGQIFYMRLWRLMVSC